MESVVLERHRTELQGAVLELVPGGSRLTEELVHQARAYTGIGPSPTVINVCRQMYLTGRFQVGDIDDLAQFEADGFEAVFAGRCAIDGLGEDRRRALLSSAHRVLEGAGLLIFSSHNAASRELRELAEQSSSKQRGGRLRGLRLRSSRAPMDERDLGNEMISGLDGNLSAGPYRITHEAQRSQLEELGFELVECLDLHGHEVPADEPAAESAELHYVARAAAPPDP